MLVTCIFFLSHNVFKSLPAHAFLRKGLCDKALDIYFTLPLSKTCNRVVKNDTAKLYIITNCANSW